MRLFSIFIAIAVIIAMTGSGGIETAKVAKVRRSGMDPDTDSFMQAPAGSFDTDWCENP